ncbi:hypothetical protein JB92DRAFT_3023029 [Gautieria morchelliformis]|nr:hypothetical protein JB92DRAFT_3023029 [Gautieria morchelliformis]
MINNLAIRMIALAVGLGALPSALSVCPDGRIGIGYASSSAGLVCTVAAGCSSTYGVIRANNCGIIASRGAAVDKDNICGIYDNGASVQCIAGTATPNTAQTGDGSDWGSCVSSEDACSDKGEEVLFCCARN